MVRPKLKPMHYGKMLEVRNKKVLLQETELEKIQSHRHISKQLCKQLMISKSIDLGNGFYFLCPRHKMARGHLVFALSVIPSFRPSVLPSFRHSVIPSHQSLSSQLLLHPCMDLNETWQGCCTTSLEVHVGR